MRNHLLETDVNTELIKDKIYLNTNIYILVRSHMLVTNVNSDVIVNIIYIDTDIHTWKMISANFFLLNNYYYKCLNNL